MSKNSVLKELENASNKEELVNWLVKNFSIEQLSDCLSSIGIKDTLSEDMSNLKIEEEIADDSDYDLLFGKMQKFGAARNMYLTTAKKTSTGNKYYTYSFKNGKWDKKGTWKSEKAIKNAKPFKGKVTKKGLTSFFGLKDLFVNTKSSGFGSNVVRLKPVHPMSFGYAKCNGDRTYGQLYPLGKYAYVKGVHKGVSSNFSEAFAKKHGLYPPPAKKIPNRWTYNEMQFGMAPVNYRTRMNLPGAFQWENSPEDEALMASFGKKKRTVAKRKSPTKKLSFGKKKKTTIKKVVKKSPVKKDVKLTKAIKTEAKKHGIKLTVKRGEKRVYKSEKMLLKQIKNKKKSSPAKTVKKQVRKTVKKPVRKTVKKPVKKTLKKKSLKSVNKKKSLRKP